MMGIERMSMLGPANSETAQCPILATEFQRVRENHATLASTGCTKQFCQAGRAVHTDEPRVGENRALHVVEQEAEEFLRELHREEFFDSDEIFEERLKTARNEIRAGAVEAIVREDGLRAKVGGNWMQTPRELEFGLRRAWRNSRKCIMRSHCEELELCDLRSVTSSAKMAIELIKGVSKAFNNGNIQPTVFVFPSRAANSRGPMIWNHQVLAFAGYEAADGSVLGDPASVQLTKEIINFGWVPPQTKSRWDLLPIVTMAEGDLPVIAELPLNLCKLVEIRHPRYHTEFERLDLKWVAFPALTRLGFDIGGVQYTAAPFIGWFMDAEIGVRNLADTFRYNVLPDVVKAICQADGEFDPGIMDLEDVPEYKKLMLLSRAQAELNYAVFWSFLQAKVTMSDSLTASMKWSQYDNEFKKKKGFRLPADPYWLAPPQGSIIPVWHRGGAPCYQPKPMICKHVEDPLKAWGRRNRNWFTDVRSFRAMVIFRKPKDQVEWVSTNTDSRISTSQNENPQEISILTKSPLATDESSYETVVEKDYLPKDEATSIAIYFCSTGVIAKKLAIKLRDRVSSHIKGSDSVDPKIEPLDALEASSITANKVLLLVVSSTGQGEIPSNGSGFPDMCSKLMTSSRPNTCEGFRFAIFGNGDSRYSSTYNGAAIKIFNHIKQIGGIPIAGGLFQADTAVEPLPLSALDSWWNKLEGSIFNAVTSHQTRVVSHNAKVMNSIDETISEISRAEGIERYRRHEQELRSNFKEATLINTSSKAHKKHQGTELVTMNIGNESYNDMSCIQVLPVNSPSKVRRALAALCVQGSTKLKLLSARDEENPTFSRFLTEFADLELPFLELKWLGRIESNSEKGLTKELLSGSAVLDVLERLHDANILSYLSIDVNLQHDMCLDMPLLHTRNYSVASSLKFLTSKPRHKQKRESSGNKVDIMVKIRQDGRFSDIFLNDSPRPALLRFRIVDSICGDIIRRGQLAPLIIIATGAGFGPVRCLLQQRMAVARDAFAVGRTLSSRGSGISLFLGLQPGDVAMTTDVLNEAAAFGLMDMLCIVPSNKDKVRVYEKLQTDGVVQHLKSKLLDQPGMVFVCTNAAAAKATACTFGRLMGGNIKKTLGERYVEEVF